MSDRLHVFVKAEASCSIDDWTINKHLVYSIIDLSETIIVSAGNTESWGQSYSSESEEVSKVHEAKRVDG